ncbi:MAG TPA: hypothetical protein VH183_11480 [Burkholderiaceae bacterium]|jgi:hypothetical protein|nr:hypothetical protein [Burkholderiaceae bacterium]
MAVIKKPPQRRRGCGQLVAPLLACAVLSPLPTHLAASPLSGPFELAQRISGDPACTRTQVIGLCWCGATPCGYQIRMYVPVAFAETVRAPGDSLLTAPLPASASSLSTLSSSGSTLDNTAEAHAWLLGNAAWLLSGPMSCLRCQPSDARSAPPPASAAADLVCGTVSKVVAALVSNILSGLPSALPSLAYASEADELNWRTGCRDVLAIESRADQLVGGLGRWGSLYPRQMRDLGTPPVVCSAKTAFRALSIARDQLGTFPFPVDLAGRMQQAYPAVSTCFDVGEQPLPQAPASDRPVQTSADGRYGWFYWRPVSCCVGFESLAHCAGAHP